MATSQDTILTIPVAKRIREVTGLIRLIENDRKSEAALTSSEGLPGQDTWRLDQALLGQHILRLYRAFTSEQAAILIQARTGYCRLNQYLSRLGVVKEAKCRYGIDDETIRHVLYICSL
jgi:hypothetical protein